MSFLIQYFTWLYNPSWKLWSFWLINWGGESKYLNLLSHRIKKGKRPCHILKALPGSIDNFITLAGLFPSPLSLNCMFLKTLQLHTFKDACKNHVPLCCITNHEIKRLTIGETYLEFGRQNNYRDLNDLNSHIASWIHITLEVLTLGYKSLFWYMWKYD